MKRTTVLLFLLALCFVAPPVLAQQGVDPMQQAFKSIVGREKRMRRDVARRTKDPIQRTYVNRVYEQLSKEVPNSWPNTTLVVDPGRCTIRLGYFFWDEAFYVYEVNLRLTIAPRVVRKRSKPRRGKKGKMRWWVEMRSTNANAFKYEKHRPKNRNAVHTTRSTDPDKMYDFLVEDEAHGNALKKALDDFKQLTCNLGGRA